MCSIPGLCPRGASNTHPPPVMTVDNVSRHIAKRPLGDKVLPLCTGLKKVHTDLPGSKSVSPTCHYHFENIFIHLKNKKKKNKKSKAVTSEVGNFFLTWLLLRRGVQMTDHQGNSQETIHSTLSQSQKIGWDCQQHHGEDGK